MRDMSAIKDVSDKPNPKNNPNPNPNPNIWEAPKHLLVDKRFIKRAVRDQPMALQYADDSMKNDAEAHLCLTHHGILFLALTLN